VLPARLRARTCALPLTAAHALPFSLWNFSRTGDDWFPVENGDQPGTLYWWPGPEIPSGMTNFLGAPTSLYSSMWSDKNVYQQAGLYKWAVDGSGSVLPVDVQFFRDIFKNGSVAQMKMFEQDFLCTYAWNTNLTTRDPDTGMQWLRAMDQAAAEAGIGLQLCMVTPLHALAATELSAVTNIRGSNDNMHADAGFMYTLGQNGLLLRGLGMFVSRDNVFTSSHEPGCGGSQNCEAAACAARAERAARKRTAQAHARSAARIAASSPQTTAPHAKRPCLAQARRRTSRSKTWPQCWQAGPSGPRMASTSSTRP